MSPNIFYTQCVQSILDTDLYKLTMQQAILKLYSDAKVSYRFKNRGQHIFTEKFIKEFEIELEKMSALRLQDDEVKYLKTLSFISPWYIEYLRSYSFDPNELSYKINDTKLELDIKGYWYKTILWEVPLMAMISEVYFKTEDINWLGQDVWPDQDKKLQVKTSKLMSANCNYADFGTRRRRNFAVQDRIVQKMRSHYWFGGTSNPFLAMKYDTKCMGTMAHEWVQGISALESMNHPNKFMLERWMSVYGSQLLIALPDTFGTKSFFKDFNKTIATIYAGVRHDSGDPFIFTDKLIQHYKSLDIDHRTKVIVFSDGLTAELAARIKKYCDERGMPCQFGIGTSFTNDFDSPALNMVIKLWDVNGFPVVKLSDIEGKENGDPEMVQIMKSIHR